MKPFPVFQIFLFFGFILAFNIPLNINGLIIENNPFYGLTSDPVRSLESTTEDNLIKVKFEYAPSQVQIGSPEFFKITLFYNEKNEIVLHADTDISFSKNGKVLYKASNEFSQPFVHTPNGIVLSSYVFPESGLYTITAKVLGINFMPVIPKEVNFKANVVELNDKYDIDIGVG